MEAAVIQFGRFTLHPAQRRLAVADNILHVGGRALDLLILLTSRPGELFSFDEITASVWNKTVVDEANVRAQIATLRKLLQADVNDASYIANVPRRGYCFVAPVSRLCVRKSDAATNIATTTGSLGPLVRAVGRGDDVLDVARQLSTERMVTIVGPGGIGKSTVAFAALTDTQQRFRDSGVSIDLSAVTRPIDLPHLVAAKLQLAAVGSSQVIRALQEKQMLLLIDSCEHLIDEVATWVEDIFSATSGIKILATSREPLRVRSERVHRLRPLRVPTTADLTASHAAVYPSVELFVERAAARLGQFELTNDTAPHVGQICRYLDGNPLAIELAAGRLETMGVSGLAASLDNCLNVLTQGMREALPRHQSMRANLEWSYNGLKSREKVALQYSSIFKSSFTFEKLRLLYPPTAGADEIDDALLSLVCKSMVSAEPSQDGTLYRLTHLTRAYASEKLMAADGMSSLLRREARSSIDLKGSARAANRPGETRVSSP